MDKIDKKELEKIIKEIIMEKLSLNESCVNYSVEYSRNLLSLKWGDEEFGESVCIETYNN